MLQSLSDTLFGEYRRRVLGLLLLHPEASFHVREIARLTDTAPGTLHKELSKLAQAGILVREPRGNQLTYRANRACPVFEELSSIMRKTSGLADVLAQALRPCAHQIDTAFVYGSTASGRETAQSDVDIMLIGDIGFARAVQQLYPAQAMLAREINPKVLSREEWRAGLANHDAFLRDVLAKPKLFVIGSDHDLGELAGNQPGRNPAGS